MNIKELQKLFVTAFGKYTIKENHLRWYANRRKKKNELVLFEIVRLEKYIFI